jgi:AbrB family transcriptional regulator (stage V sporulation protein T)
LKTTGVSRRIDDLGRIVIPKEIRKNLKIRDGELLEISVQNEQVVLTKNSTMRGVSDIAKQCVEAVNEALGVDIIITDRDRVIAASPQMRKKYIDTELSIELSEKMLKRNVISEHEVKELKINDYEEEHTPYVLYPVIVDGDVAGSVIIFGINNKITEVIEKVADVVSKFLTRNII